MESLDSIGSRVRVTVFLVLAVSAGWLLFLGLAQEAGPGPGDLRFQALFGQVAGLKTGAPVRLAGVDVGRVLDLEFVVRDGKDTIAVSLFVRAKFARLVRKDARLSIDSLGVLGDKYVEISLTQPTSAPLTASAIVLGGDPVTLASTMKKLDDAADDFQVVTRFMRKIIEKTEGVKTLWEKFKASFSEK